MEAATYLRKSVVKDDKDAESIDVQRKRNKAYAASQGWTITREYVDEGISASKGLLRPDFLRLIADVESGVVKRIVVRDQARLSRADIELFIFLRTVEQHNVEVRDSYGNQIRNDLQTKVKGIIDADYSAEIARRTREKKAYNAAQGKAPASRNRPYGYKHSYTEIVTEEAEVLKEAAKRVLAGETLYAIAKTFNDRGTYKYTGKLWVASDLSKLLLRSENAGIRSYKGEEVANGDWPTIFDVEAYRRLQEKLGKNQAYSSSTARKYLLVGILVCNECGTTLSASKPSYRCNPGRGGCGKIVRNRKAVDDYMLRRVYEVIKALPVPDEKPKVDPVAEEIARLETKISEAMQAWKDDVIGLADYTAIKNDSAAKIATLRKQQNVTASLPVNNADDFLAADVDKQRATIRRLYPVVGVKPTGQKGKRFNPEQLVFG